MLSAMDPEDHTIAEALLLEACSNVESKNAETHSSHRIDLLKIVAVEEMPKESASWALLSAQDPEDHTGDC